MLRMMGTGLLSLGLAGCLPGESHAAFTVVDSAGIPVARNRMDAEALPRLAPSERLLTIGTVDGAPEQQFYRVMDGVHLEDGRIAVLNAGTQELRFYDAGGRFLSAQGRSGDGPGEYRFPYRLLRLSGDSLLVYDYGLVRFTVISPGGEAARTFTPSRAVLNEPLLAGVVGDSVAIAHERILRIPEQGFDTVYTRVAFVHLDGSGTDSLMLPGERMGHIGPPGRGLVGSPLFEARLAVAADHDGLWAGSARAPEVVRYDVAGRVVRVIRWDAAPVAVRDRDVEREIERRTEGRGDRAQELRSWYGDVPAAEAFPFYDELDVDRQLRLWVREYVPPASTEVRRWLVFAPEGRVQQRVELPTSLKPLEIDRDELLAVRTDELDVEHVELWRLAPVDGAREEG